MRFVLKALAIPMLLLALACGGGGGGGGTNPTSSTAPTNLKLSDGVLFDVITLTWTPPASPIDGYEFEWKQGEGTFQKLQEGLLPADWIGIQITMNQDMPELIDLTFRLRAMKAGTASSYTNEVLYSRGIRPVENLGARMEQGMYLSWMNRSKVADGIRIERATLTSAGGWGAWAVIATVSPQETAFTDIAIEEGTSYKYQVSAFKGTRSSWPLGREAQVGLLPPRSVASQSLENGILLTWENWSTRATEIVIRRLSLTDGQNVEIAHLPPTATTYQDLGLPMGAYGYLVQAHTASDVANSPFFYGSPLPPSAVIRLLPEVLSAPLGTKVAIRRPQGGWILGGSRTWSPAIQAFPGLWPEWSPGTLGSGWWNAPYIQVDSLGFPHTVILRGNASDPTSTDILHTWFDGTRWNTEAVAQRNFTYSSSNTLLTFAIDALDRLHLVWNTSFSYSTGMEYAYQVGGTWIIESLDILRPAVPTPGAFRLVLDTKNDPHVFLATGTALVELKRSSLGTWSTDQIPTGAVQAGSYDLLEVAVAGSETEAVVFQRTHVPSEPNLTTDLFCIRKVGGSWQTPEWIAAQDRTDRGVVVALSRDGSRLAIYDNANGQARILVPGTSGWQATPLGRAMSGSVAVPTFGFTEGNRIYLRIVVGSDYIGNDLSIFFMEQP